MGLSNADIRILRFVSATGINEPERLMAKKLRLSPSTLIYKLRKFEAEKTIACYRYKVDFTKIGLKQIAWVFLTLKHKETDIEQLLDGFLKHPQIHIVLFLAGKFDMALKVYAKDLTEITEFVLQLERELAEEIKSTSTYFVLGQFKMHDVAIGNTPSKGIKLDARDLRILSHRMERPDASIKEVSAALSLHRNTVSAKWRRLLNKGVVLKKKAIINPDRHYDIGIAFTAVVLLNSVVGKKEELARELAGLPEVHEVNVISFPYDLMAIVRAADINSFYSLYKQFFKSKPFNSLITELESFIILKDKSHEHTYIKEIGVENLLG